MQYSSFAEATGDDEVSDTTMLNSSTKAKCKNQLQSALHTSILSISRTSPNLAAISATIGMPGR